MTRFRDREEAGRLLAAELRADVGPHAIVLGLPRGGVVVGYQVARALSLPLDVWIVRKIGVPWQPELGMGAVAEGGYVYLSQEILGHVGLSQDELSTAIETKRREVEERVRRYRRDQPRPVLRDRAVIVVDDGIATGGTVRAAVRSIRSQHPRKLVLAAPIGAADTIAALAPELDRVVCLEVPTDLYAIGHWYESFTQVETEEVVRLLERARQERATAARVAL